MNTLSTIPPIALLVTGLVLCFFGYRLLRLTLGIAGFAVGLAIGLAVAGLLPHASQILTVIVGIVCGILGALAATLLYKLGVFLLGAGAGALVAGIVLTATGSHYALLIRVIAAIAGGILTLVLERPLVSILSAVAGGWGVAFGAFRLLGLYHATASAGKQPAGFGLMVACWVLLALLGIGVQLRSGRKHRKQPPPARPE